MKLEDSARRTRPTSAFKTRVCSYLALFLAATLLTATTTALWSFSVSPQDSANSENSASDPADEWKDDIWPIRPSAPWDISTDFPFSRVLEYDVEEGTWLRLDVHPINGDIVFDMLGDLYCISSYTTDRNAVASAHPILLGIPHDADPHFSPDGDRLVFRSDAELGVENIWVMPWTGCENMNLRPKTFGENDVLQNALRSKVEDEELLAKGVLETPERKINRLIREGRYGGVCICYSG